MRLIMVRMTLGVSHFSSYCFQYWVYLYQRFRVYVLGLKVYLGKLGADFKCTSIFYEKAGVFNDVMCETCLELEPFWRKKHGFELRFSVICLHLPKFSQKIFFVMTFNSVRRR